eukprot:TRINITY_DN9963_c0_g1_i2.p1 TRINITY_DN9963_c0_g1~~TRINITY_DN9963_c0_g1_i2.p1  ORF type:complete len:192 (-),score=34.83 TRINITY_DN9963_c0_g1_i2:25-600(-)
MTFMEGSIPVPVSHYRRKGRKTKSKNLGSLLSRGSKNHDQGFCRPCLHIANGEQCPDGQMCNFCHEPHDETDEAKVLRSAAEDCYALEQARSYTPTSALSGAESSGWPTIVEGCYPLKPAKVYTPTSSSDSSVNPRQKSQISTIKHARHFQEGVLKTDVNILQLCHGSLAGVDRETLAQALKAAMPEYYED